MKTAKVQKVLYNSVKEEFKDIASNYNAAKAVMSMHNEKVGYYTNTFGYRNALIELKDRDDLFITSVAINGQINFNSKQHNGIERKYLNDLEKTPYHPKNIERITIIVDGEEYEFVACQ